MVTRPAVRAVTATVMVSPGLYSGLSSAISSMSGRIGRRLGVPAGVERDRGARTACFGAGHFEAIAAPLHRRGDAGRLAGLDIDAAVGDAARRLDRLELPAAVAAVPLLARIDLRAARSASPCRQAACRPDATSTTSKVAVSPSPSERPENSGFTPIMLAAATTGSVILRSTARPPASAMRTITCASSGRDEVGNVVERHIEARLALVVGLRQVFERLAAARRLLVGLAELVAGEPQAFLRGRDRDLAFEIERGRRRAIEIAAVDSQASRALSGQSCRRAPRGRTRAGRARSPRPGTWFRRPTGASDR